MLLYQTENIFDVWGLTTIFLPSCENDLLELSLDKEEILGLINREFVSHDNYFKYDLEDYAMPIQRRLIVHFDKIEDTLTIRRVFSCTQNEAKLASWNYILALYRKAARMAYREDPNQVLLNRDLPVRVMRIHHDLMDKIKLHFDKYDASTEDGSSEASVSFYLEQAQEALEEAHNIRGDFAKADIVENAAIAGIIICFERSLHYIHKVLTQFPPIS